MTNSNQLGYGLTYICQTCDDFNICKKCHGRIDEYHNRDDEPLHVFKIIPESFEFEKLPVAEVNDGQKSPSAGKGSSPGAGGGKADDDDVQERLKDMEALDEIDIDGV